MRKVLLVILLLGFAAQANSQSSSQLIKWGEESCTDGDYYGASLYYERAMAMDSLDLNLLWKYAESLRLYNNYKKASFYYAKIYKKDRGKLFPLNAFHLAMMYKQSGDYRHSKKTWKKFNRKYKRQKDGYEYKKSQQEYQSVAWAVKHIKDTSDVLVENVGMPVNSRIAEFGAIFKDSTLYYSSLRAKEYGENRLVLDPDYHIRLYTSDVEGEGWAESELMPEIINQGDYHVANGAFSPDGERFYFSRCGQDFKCGIFFTSLENDEWKEPVELTGLNDPSYTTTQPSVGMISGKEVLFFASDRPGGKGALDIWYISLTDGNTSGNVTNAGENVNSIDNEISPFYSNLNGSLYFSSDWHEGFGGFDIFEVKGSLGDFTYPINLGTPYNSYQNDYYFSIDVGTGKGFLTSNRVGSLYEKSPTCCNDLWSFEIPKDPADTLPYSSLEDLMKFLPVTLYFHNDRPDPRTTTDSTSKNYIDTYQDYLDLKAEYVTENRSGNSGDAADDAELEISDFYQFRVEKGVRDLRVFSKLLLTELDKGQEVELTIQGFASPLAKTDYNVHLTGRRITSLINFLYHYQASVFKPYMDGTAENGGRLTFTKIPFGEYTADTEVTDDRSDGDAVYSVGAAQERKIQIISVQQAKRDSTFAEMTFDQQIWDFGNQIQGDTATATLAFSNTGNLPLQIDSLIVDCDCIVASADQLTIEPGAQGTITLTFYSANEEGLVAKHIRVVTNGVPAEKTLSITTEVMTGQ